MVTPVNPPIGDPGPRPPASPGVFFICGLVLLVVGIWAHAEGWFWLVVAFVGGVLVVAGAVAEAVRLALRQRRGH